MKICKALFLLGLFFASTESNVDVFTTSHVQKANQRHRGRNIRPKQHFCSEGHIEKVQCIKQSSDACNYQDFPTQAPVCAFDRFGVKFDFKRQCEACEHDNINYYLRSTCDKIPKICTKTEECVNGVCVALMNDPGDTNRIVCNEKDDCPSKTDLCVANKCVDKRELIKRLSAAERTNPELAETNRRVRKEAMRFELQRRLKDFEGIKRIRAELQALKSKNRNRNRNRKQRGRAPLPNQQDQIASN